MEGRGERYSLVTCFENRNSSTRQNHTWNGGNAALGSANAAALTHDFLLRRWLLRTSPAGNLTSSAAECCGRR